MTGEGFAMNCPGCGKTLSIHFVLPPTKQGGLMEIQATCEWCGYFSSTNEREVRHNELDLVVAKERFR